LVSRTWANSKRFLGRCPSIIKAGHSLIEHRKFGVGVFVHDLEKDERSALEIVAHIKKATRAAEPFFDWLADKAVEASFVNVTNNSDALFARFNYFREAYRHKAAEAVARKGEKIITEGETTSGKWTSISRPAFQLRTEAQWLALTAIESFFSWTEHVFIHISILNGRLQTGKRRCAPCRRKLG
jgi:hypothetical protein